MKNIGPVSSRWLAGVGIHTLDELRSVGVVNAYNQLRCHGYRVSLNLLWALQGAVMNVHWTRLPDSVKQDLRQRVMQIHETDH